MGRKNWARKRLWREWRAVKEGKEIEKKRGERENVEERKEKCEKGRGRSFDATAERPKKGIPVKVEEGTRDENECRGLAAGEAEMREIAEQKNSGKKRNGRIKWKRVVIVKGQARPTRKAELLQFPSVSPIYNQWYRSKTKQKNGFKTYSSPIKPGSFLTELKNSIRISSGFGNTRILARTSLKIQPRFVLFSTIRAASTWEYLQLLGLIYKLRRNNPR